MGDLVGRTLGSYRVLEQLGMGGMATVYKAYHPAMDRYVAIKVLPQHMARDPNFRARFQREARTIARLEHRHILTVYDVGEADEIPFLVMRYTEGGTLSDLIAAQALTPERAVRLVMQVGEALAYAHRRGVIHRDIKPANVLISHEGDALLSDFGIAKIVEGTLQLTSEGALIGTPFYMAPEQAQGQPADARTDLYSLGVILYETLTGRRPYMAETPLAVALMHIHDSLPPPRQLNPSIPEALERVILRAMAKNPADRYQTADEMVVALRDALAQLSPSAAAAPAPAPSPRPAATVALIESQPAAAAAESHPPAAPSMGWLRARPWLLGLLAIPLVALAAVLLVRPQPAIAPTPAPETTSAPVAAAATGVAATAAPTAASAEGVTPGSTVTPQTRLQVFGNATRANGLAPLADALWAATDGGLVRFTPDGKARVFTVADGLPSNWTPSILAAPDGSLWTGSYGSVAHIRPEGDGLGEVTIYREEDGLDIGAVQVFMIDADKSIWAGGEYGLRRFDGERWEVLELPSDDPALKDLESEVRALLRDQAGALWIGFSEGLLRWDGARWTVFGEEQGVGQVPIYRLLQSQDGAIWAAANGAGLLRFDTAQDRWQAVPGREENEDVLSIAQLADGQLWVTTANGVAQLAEDGTGWAHIAAPEDYPGWAGSGAIAQDNSGRVWIGAGAGVSIFDGGRWRRAERPVQLPMNDIGKLLSAEGRLWAIEQYGGALASVDPASMQIEIFQELPDTRIGAVAFTEGITWVGTSNGLVRLRDGATLRLTTSDGLPSDQIRQLLVTTPTLWIGTSGGLAALDLASGKISPVAELEGGIIDALLLAPDGAVWAGSHREGDLGRGALGRFDGKAWQIWQQGDLPESDNGVDVTALAADAQGRIWVSTWASGLYRWDGANWRTWTAEDGAPSGSVLALVPRDGEIWAAGQLDRVIYRWNEDGWARVQVDGLSGFVNTMQFTPDGALWMGTNDGLLRYQP